MLVAAFKGPYRVRLKISTTYRRVTGSESALQRVREVLAMSHKIIKVGPIGRSVANHVPPGMMSDFLMSWQIIECDTYFELSTFESQITRISKNCHADIRILNWANKDYANCK